MIIIIHSVGQVLCVHFWWTDHLGWSWAIFMQKQKNYKKPKELLFRGLLWCVKGISCSRNECVCFSVFAWYKTIYRKECTIPTSARTAAAPTLTMRDLQMFSYSYCNNIPLVSPYDGLVPIWPMWKRYTIYNNGGSSGRRGHHLSLSQSVICPHPLISASYSHSEQ